MLNQRRNKNHTTVSLCQNKLLLKIKAKEINIALANLKLLAKRMNKLKIIISLMPPTKIDNIGFLNSLIDKMIHL